MFRSRLYLARLLFHPLAQLRLFEAPAVAQVEGGNLLFPYVLVERVRTHSQIVRRLTNVHHFPRVGHGFLRSVPCLPPPLPRRYRRPAGLTLANFLHPPCLSGRLSVSRGYISPERPRVKASFRVLWAFMPIFWNSRKGRRSGISICCGIGPSIRN